MSVIRLVDKGFDSYFNNNKIYEDLSKAIKYFYASIVENYINDVMMNDAVYKFKRYEDSSLEYVGINRHAGKDVGV